MLTHNPYVIYLSGGMTGIPKEEASSWRKRFKELFYEKLIELKQKDPFIKYPSPFIIIDPTDTFYPSPDNSLIYEREAYNYETYWVLNSDIIVANLNSLSSIGTAQELMLAKNHSIDVIGFIEKEKLDKIHPWNEISCTIIRPYELETFEKELKYIASIIIMNSKDKKKGELI